MKSICIIAIAVFSGLVVAYGQPLFKESIEQQIIAKEREELDALKRGDINAFAKLIADEAVFVNAQGPGSKAEVVRHVADFKLLEFSMEDIRFVPLSEKSGLIAYKLIQKGSSHGREFTSQVYASALWTKRDGKWLCLFSQETGARGQKSEVRDQ